MCENTWSGMQAWGRIETWYYEHFNDIDNTVNTMLWN